MGRNPHSFTLEEVMAIIRNTYTDALFNGLMAAGCTIYGACGAMGNIYAESGANPRNLENLCEKRLNYKYTDDTYTTAVDSGEITRDLFLHPLGDFRQYGYGFCQWTSAGRKAGLYDLVKSKGVSIGDPDTQVEFMLKELQQSYKSVLQVLKTATSVQEASDIFLVKFEVPANTGSEVKKARSSYREQYLKIYKDIEKEETNMSLISNSGHDENGKYSGGKAGDQTGTEWALIPWYNRPWKCVLRHPDAKVRAKLAELGIKAAKNDLVGYDQGQRGTYWEHLKASNYDPSQITIACEGDCSAGVIANIKAAGYLLGIDALKNINATYTGNLRSGAKAAGFQVLTESKYLTGPDYLLAGDILLNDSHHTATNVQDGSKSGGAGTSGSGSTNSGSGTISGGNSKTANIKNGQQWLNSNYGDKLIQFCGAKLEVDGSYGPASRWGALAIWKDLMNRKYGTKLTPTNKNFYGSCKEVAGKAGVHSGTVGTFTFIAQFILSAKGYYTGAMDASCGSKLVEAITAFQKANGLDADGWCGADTWYALFN
ncbi:hypothetical protein 2011_scaffold13_00066 [Bacteriophage sp.]|nr:hypothetical protein 2011_scaffold13_00066 [Bacteriophage sp.]